MPACEIPSITLSLVHAPHPLVGDDRGTRGYVRAFGLRRRRWFRSSPGSAEAYAQAEGLPLDPGGVQRLDGARDAESKEPREPAEPRRHGSVA